MIFRRLLAAALLLLTFVTLTPARVAAATAPVLSLIKFVNVSIDQINLTWTDRYSSSYTLERRRMDEMAWTIVDTAASAVSDDLPVERYYNDVTAAPGIRYFYRVTATGPEGQTIRLSSSIIAADPTVVLADNFDVNRDESQWSYSSVTDSFASYYGFNGSKVLWFGHAGERMTVTAPVNIPAGGSLTFAFRQGNVAGDPYWDLSEDSGKAVVLERSDDNGATWTTLYNLYYWVPWTNFLVTLEPTSTATATRPLIRWRQLNHDGEGLDTWAIDNVKITANTVPGPAIIQQPAPDLAMESGPAMLEVIPNHVELTFQWYRNDEIVPGATKAAYAIPAVTAAQAGVYFCRISDGTESVDSDKVPLGVFSRAGSDQPLHVDVGGGFFLGVQALPLALAADSNLGFSWVKLPFGNILKSGQVSGYRAKTLFVNLAQPAADGDYACYITYPGAETLAVGLYSVIIRPIPFISAIIDQTCVVGHPVYLPIAISDSISTVTVKGLPAGLSYNKLMQSIVGTPKSASSTTVTLSARNYAGDAVPVTFQLVVQPFPPEVSGSYSGVIGHQLGSAPSFRGVVRFQVSRTGSASGAFTIDGKTYPFTCPVPAEPEQEVIELNVPIFKKGVPWFTCRLVLSAAVQLHTGTLFPAGNEADFSPVSFVRNDWSAADPVPEPGLYNLATVPPPEVLENPALPHGASFFGLKIATTGTVMWTGRLADGQATIGSTLISRDGYTPMAQFIYGNTGSFTAIPRCFGASAYGEVTWVKAAPSGSVTTSSYKAGIPYHDVGLIGGLYPKAATMASLPKGFADPYGKVELRLADADLPASDPLLFTLMRQPGYISGGRVQVLQPPSFRALPPNVVSLTVNAATGLFNGTFDLKIPASANSSQQVLRGIPIYGCFVPGLIPEDGQAIHATGHFLMPQQATADAPATPGATKSGSVSLDAASASAP